jgi:hypothetical protein
VCPAAFGTWAADLARWLLRDGFAVGTINNNCAWLLLWLWSSSTFLWDSWADNHAPLPDWMQATLGLHCQLLSGLFQQDSTTGQLCHDRGEARTAATFQVGTLTTHECKQTYYCVIPPLAMPLAGGKHARQRQLLQTLY